MNTPVPPRLSPAGQRLFRAAARVAATRAPDDYESLHDEVQRALEMRWDGLLDTVATGAAAAGFPAAAQLLAIATGENAHGVVWQEADGRPHIFMPFHLPVALTLLPDDSDELVKSASVLIDSDEVARIGRETLLVPEGVQVLFAPQFVHYATVMDLPLSSRYRDVQHGHQLFLKTQALGQPGFDLPDRRGFPVQLGTRLPGASTLVLRVLTGALVGPRESVQLTAPWFTAEAGLLAPFSAGFAGYLAQRFQLKSASDFVVCSDRVFQFGDVRAGVIRLSEIIQEAMRQAKIPMLANPKSTVEAN